MVDFNRIQLMDEMSLWGLDPERAYESGHPAPLLMAIDTEHPARSTLLSIKFSQASLASIVASYKNEVCNNRSSGGRS